MKRQRDKVNFSDHYGYGQIKSENTFDKMCKYVVKQDESIQQPRACFVLDRVPHHHPFFPISSIINIYSIMMMMIIMIASVSHLSTNRRN